MTRDKRYSTVKKLISGNYIQTLSELFDTVPKSVVAKDLGLNGVRINNLINNVGRFYVKDLFKLAEVVGVDEIEIMKLICNQHAADKKSKRKPKA